MRPTFPGLAAAEPPFTGAMHCARRILSAFLVAGGVLLVPWSACAQPHSSEAGGYILRSSIAPSQYLSDETARAHGIQPGPRRAVVNVSVYRKQGNEKVTVPARIEVTARDLSGVTKQVAMREAQANGWVSYVGSYDFVNSEVVDFTVAAVPAGSNVNLNLDYRERLWTSAR